MANEDLIGAGEAAHVGEKTPPPPSSEEYSLSASVAPLQSISLRDNQPTIMPSRKDGTPGNDKSHEEDAEYQKFFKSVEARIDPEDPPNLLLTEPDLQKIGTIQIGNYTCPLIDQIALIRKLGEGGNGSVFLGYQHRFGEVALKTLKIKVLQSDPSMVGRFFLEARLSKKFTSPHIVKTFDARREGSLNFLVMEYIAGIDASGYLKKLKQRAKGDGIVTGVPEKEALQICAAACAGLKALHDYGVMHRDIKPQNIMVPYERNTEELKFSASKLMDLGLAKTTDTDAPTIMRKEDDPTIQGTLLGTPGYMSPEQVIDCSTVGAGGDIFSLGATLYCLMCGSPPFRDVQGPLATASATIHGNHIPIMERCAKNKIAISRGAATIIEQCLRKNIAERYTEAGELLADLERVLAGKEPFAKRPPRRGMGPWFWVGGGATVVAAGVAALLILKPFSGPKLENHEKFIQQAIATLAKDEFLDAREFVQLATDVRRASPLRNDDELINKENDVSNRIQVAKEKFTNFFKAQVAEFKNYVKTEDFVNAAAKLEAIKGYEKHLPDKPIVPTLQTEFDGAKRVYDIRKANEERDRKLSFDNALSKATAALSSSKYDEAEREFKIAQALDKNDAAILQLGKDIPRQQRAAQIGELLKNGGDLKTARTLLAEVKQIEPSHALVGDLTARIAAEEARRSIVATLDEKLALLQAGKGDLGEVTITLNQLAADDPDRKTRDVQAAKARAEFDAALSAGKTLLAGEKDLPTAEIDLKTAQKLWPSNPDLKAQFQALESANATFDKLISEIKAGVETNLADAQTKYERVRAMKPADASVAASAKLIDAEKQLQTRITGLQTLVNDVDSVENYDAVKTELEALSAMRKDQRIDAAQAQFSSRLKAHQTKLRDSALAQLQADFKKLGKYGDGRAYTAFQKRLDDLVLSPPLDVADPRINVLSSTFAEKNKEAEEASVFGWTRRLNAAAAAYQAGTLNLKKFEDTLINGEDNFPAAFPSQRKAVEDAKTALSEKLAQASELVRNQQNLDAAQEIVTATENAYAGFKGANDIQLGIDRLNAGFARDLASARTKLETGDSLEGLDDIFRRALQMHPKDVAALGLQKALDSWKDILNKALTSAPAIATDGNLDSADAELKRVSKLFPSDAGIPKAEQLLKEARAVVQKELVDAETALGKATEKGNFAKATEILERAQKRVPGDATIARLEELRQKAIAAAEALVPSLEKTLSAPLTAETQLQASQLLDRIELVGPHAALRASFKKRSDELAAAREAAAREAAAAARVRAEQAAPKPAKTTSTEDPSNFGN